MEIKIDTKKDSTEDIRHTIEFLQKFIASSSNSSTPEFNTKASPGMFGMFNNNNDDEPKSEPEPEPKVQILEY